METTKAATPQQDGRLALTVQLLLNGFPGHLDVHNQFVVFALVHLCEDQAVFEGIVLQNSNPDDLAVEGDGAAALDQLYPKPQRGVGLVAVLRRDAGPGGADVFHLALNGRIHLQVSRSVQLSLCIEQRKPDGRPVGVNGNQTQVLQLAAENCGFLHTGGEVDGFEILVVAPNCDLLSNRESRQSERIRDALDGDTGQAEGRQFTGEQGGAVLGKNLYRQVTGNDRGRAIASTVRISRRVFHRLGPGSEEISQHNINLLWSIKLVVSGQLFESYAKKGVRIGKTYLDLRQLDVVNNIKDKAGAEAWGTSPQQKQTFPILPISLY